MRRAIDLPDDATLLSNTVRMYSILDEWIDEKRINNTHGNTKHCLTAIEVVLIMNIMKKRFRIAITVD